MKPGRPASSGDPVNLSEDILAQPEAFRLLAETGPAQWDRALAAIGDLGRFPRVVFTGMGSSYFAAQVAAGALAALGIPAACELSSTLLHHGLGRLAPDDLLVVISQSGESAEVVKLLSSLAQGGQGPPGRPTVLAVTCHGASSVGGMAQAVFVVEVPPDHGVAVKTYGADLLALLYLVARLAGVRLGQERRRVAGWGSGARLAAQAVAQANVDAHAWRAAGKGFEPFRAIAVTGRGLSLSAAMAGALLFNEVAKTPAWAVEAGEFRHGVIEVADPALLVAVVMSPGACRDLDAALMTEVAATGAQVVAVAPRSCTGVVPTSAGSGAREITLLSVPDLDEPFLPLVQVVPFQWLSLGLAEARGFEPGRFRNMPGVVRSEGGEQAGRGGEARN